MGLLSNIGQGLSAAFQLPGAQSNANNAQAQAYGVKNQFNNRINQGNLPGASTLSVQNLSSSGVNPNLTIGNLTGSQPMGANAKAPTLAPQSNSLPAGNTAPPKPNTSLNAIPGETFAQYEARVGGTSTPPASAPPVGGAASGGLTPDQIAAANANANSTSNNPAVNPNAGQTNAYTNTGAPGFSQTVGAAAATASQPSAAFTQAQQTAQQALADLNTSKQNEASALSLNAQNLIPLEFQQGRGQILQNQYLAQQNALASEYQGAVALEGTATGQQSTQQSGLLGAAGLQAPQNANALGTYNPATGQYSGYGGGSGTSGLGNAGIALGTLGVAQQIPQMAASLQQAQGIASNFTNWLQSNPVNTSDVNLVNQLQNWAQGGNFSDPSYPELNQFLNEYLNTITPLIGAGGLPTNFKQQLVTSMINPSSSSSSIQSQIQNLQGIAQSKLNSLYSSVGATPPNGTGNTSASASGSTTFGSFSGG